MPRIKKRRTCSPPKTVSVKGYYRKSGAKRRRKKSSSRALPKGFYWVAVNDAGRTCGHHHRRFTAAVACSNRKDRAERAYRARHNKRMPRGGVWHISRRKGR